MKKINIVLFGVGNVGSTFINQVLAEKDHFLKQGLEITIPVIANSKIAFFQKDGIHSSWESDLESFGFPYNIRDIIDYVKEREYQNLIAIDATASEAFVENYGLLVRSGFHIVAANKVANTLSSEFYTALRKTLKKYKKEFLYETNVGAGLPIVQTLQDLARAGEKITRVRGVFSGSLSYIFNTFSEEDKDFNIILQAAREKGLTEPDPRVDLSGKDVGRKLLILARELNLNKELDDVQVEDLVPRHLNGKTRLKHFQKKQKDLNLKFKEIKGKLKPDEVLRYVGELDLTTGKLEVKLVKEKKTSAFGGLKNTDSSFEIYTESYGDYPLVIQGAGAGASVTARGVVSDVIKLSEKIG